LLKFSSAGKTLLYLGGFLFSGTIVNAFDSHVHWQATGASAQRLCLKNIKNLESLKNLKPEISHYLDSWLIGYGWDDNSFDSQSILNRQTLDQIFPNHPVVFSRVDGHAYWVNTATLKYCDLFYLEIELKKKQNLYGGRIEIGNDGWPSGILVDRAMNFVRQKMPAPTHAQMVERLKLGQNIFHKAGFTHIRDLTCDEIQWEAIRTVVDNQELQLAVEEWVGCYDPALFDARLEWATHLKNEKCSSLIRIQGVKVFFDGALGSESALVSCGYRNTNNHGLQLIEVSLFAEMMKKSLSQGLDLAVHIIGDEAAHKVAETAEKIWPKKNSALKLPTLHLEHAEILRPETIAILKKLNVFIHMQPCHWFSDRRWLKDKIGPLMPYIFPWEKLELVKIPFAFGSDAPIEPSSLQLNLDAVYDLEEKVGIKAVKNPEKYHSHKDIFWTPDTWTQWKHGQPIAMQFLGKSVLL